MSLVFRKPEIKDKPEIQKILNQENNIHSESAFGTWFFWADALKIEFCQIENILFKKYGNNETIFEFPRGTSSVNKLRNAILMLIRYAQTMHLPEFKFTDLLSSEVTKLQNAFPEKFKITANRDNYEYIYKTKDLALLPGKKYHGKKNHISKFSKMYDWNYCPLDHKNKEKYLRFIDTWFKEKMPCEKIKKDEEYIATNKAISHMDKLEVLGGTIEIDNKIAAFTMGERINNKTFLIQFEKALPKYSNAYSVINREFAKTLLGKYDFINREEDLGIPGLRKAKLSYKPVALVPKYDAVLMDYQI